ncbi:aminomethyltransferase family protein [Pseudophaeobacter sp.]|uniref:aminomethyltransferase family protein n=1 Tax=Pseudophaeobacter sp. TaxID=1971739 RepID=UPI00329A266A
MHPSLKKLRFSVKPIPVESQKPVELARSMDVHPLTYQELPYDPEYSLYAGRLTPERMSNATADEMYWKARQGIILRHTGEHPFEIAGPDALKLLQRIFPRDVSKVKTGRCSYQFACYDDGGMITDGLLLRIAPDRFWFAQADGDLFSWYKAHSIGLDVTISDPEVWVSQIQGPHSMKLLEHLLDGPMPDPWRYFDWTEVSIAGEKVIISRTGFTNELGWEIYFRPENDIEMLGDLILEEGTKMGMILTATPGFRGRRIEAGLLSAGQDFTKDTTPFAVGLGKFIDFDSGDFVGREALLAADRTSRSWGIRVEGGTALRGRTLRQDGQSVGRVTSSTWSPYQLCGIGIVHLDSTELQPGDIVEVDCDDGEKRQGQLCSLPMYDPKGEIVRGINTTVPAAPESWPGIKIPETA